MSKTFKSFLNGLRVKTAHNDNYLHIDSIRKIEAAYNAELAEAVALIHGRHSLNCGKCYDDLDLAQPPQPSGEGQEGGGRETV